jgi:hypothetical protein
VRRLLVLTCVAVALAVAPAAMAGGRLSAVELPAAGQLTTTKLVARAAPDPHAAKVLVLRQFRADFRWQVVLALSARKGADGRLWYRLSLPMRPNNTLGWAPAAALDVHPVRNRIIVTSVDGGSTCCAAIACCWRHPSRWERPAWRRRSVVST